ncbi:MAG TPA: acyl-CoA dehydrogenase family protein, partial [Planctomycetaceae bacterium]|nr:acyl-CoA dehydrogenase family protein [Planctomycetaceae bacterium]
MKDLIVRLAELAGPLDASGQWPALQFELLSKAGVLGWVVPREFGGAQVSERELLTGYVEMASACLTTTFVLTQRHGACQRIAASDNQSLKADLLPKLVRGEIFATVGISHLTTSRQHWRTPAVEVAEEGAAYRLNGEVPWVTGAAHADYLVTGGTLVDGRQLLATVPTTLSGVVIGPAAKLLALGASHTSSVRLDNVLLDRRFLIAGPAEQAARQTAGTGSFGTSALAVGLAQAAIDGLSAEAAVRPDLMPILDPLQQECSALKSAIDLAADAAAGAQDQ